MTRLDPCHDCAALHRCPPLSTGLPRGAISARQVWSGMPVMTVAAPVVTPPVGLVRGAAPRVTRRPGRLLTGYAELLGRIQAQGLMDRRYLHYAVKSTLLVAAVAGVWCGIFVLGESWFAAHRRSGIRAGVGAAGVSRSRRRTSADPPVRSQERGAGAGDRWAVVRDEFDLVGSRTHPTSLGAQPDRQGPGHRIHGDPVLPRRHPRRPGVVGFLHARQGLVVLPNPDLRGTAPACAGFPDGPEPWPGHAPVDGTGVHGDPDGWVPGGDADRPAPGDGGRVPGCADGRLRCLPWLHARAQPQGHADAAAWARSTSSAGRC